MLQFAVACLLILSVSSHIEADDPVQSKLDEVTGAYPANIEKAQKALLAVFDEKIETAIKAGNFEAVKRIKAEKEAFEKDATAPKTTSMRVHFASYQRAVKQANLDVENAYKKAIQDFTKANQLDNAEAANAGLTAFKHPSAKAKPSNQTASSGNSQWLSELPEFDVKVAEGRFAKNGNLGYSAGNSSKIKFQGKESPHAISTCPVQGDCAIAKFHLPADAQTFITSAALNDSAGASGAAPGVGRINSAITFQVLGDDKVLWESKPVDVACKAQECKVDVTGVKVLELRVNCPGKYVNAHAVWLEPRISK
jgi:hypothetical protein